MSLLELFCAVDDFWMSFAPMWYHTQSRTASSANEQGTYIEVEIMTILIHFHQSHSRTFKAYYTEYVQVHLKSEFPRLVSYQRFVGLIPQMLVPMLAYLSSQYGACTGISFIDSTSLEVCHPKRISQHRVFAGQATRVQDESALVLWLQTPSGGQ